MLRKHNQRAREQNGPWQKDEGLVWHITLISTFTFIFTYITYLKTPDVPSRQKLPKSFRGRENKPTNSSSLSLAFTRNSPKHNKQNHPPTTVPFCKLKLRAVRSQLFPFPRSTCSAPVVCPPVKKVCNFPCAAEASAICSELWRMYRIATAAKSSSVWVSGGDAVLDVVETSLLA